MTNLEYIKSLSAEEFARFMAAKMGTWPCDYCKYAYLSCDEKCWNKTVEDIVEEWLKREKDKCI